MGMHGTLDHACDRWLPRRALLHPTKTAYSLPVPVPCCRAVPQTNRKRTANVNGRGHSRTPMCIVRHRGCSRETTLKASEDVQHALHERSIHE